MVGFVELVVEAVEDLVQVLGRLETPTLWPASADQPPQMTSAHRLADAVQSDVDFMQVAALYAGRADFQLPQLVSDLVAAESVPFLPVLRYTDSGLRKREQWEATWALQRHEDRIDAEVEAEAPGWREELHSQAVKRFGSATTPDAMAWVEDQLAQEIAQQKPRTLEALERMRAVQQGFGKSRHGAGLLQAINEALDAPEKYAPVVDEPERDCHCHWRFLFWWW